MKKVRLLIGVLVGFVALSSVAKAESIGEVQKVKREEVLSIESKVKSKEEEIIQVKQNLNKKIKELESDVILLKSIGVLPKDTLLKGVKGDSIIKESDIKVSKENLEAPNLGLKSLNDLEFSIKALEKSIVIKDKELEHLKNDLSIANNALKDVETFLYPTKGVETSPFGWRRDPIGGFRSFHQGLDIAGSGEVWCSNYGKVSRIGYDKSAGNYVVVTHGVFNGVRLETKYFHLSKILVRQGQSLKKGQVLGIQGTTGYSTGVHLHFQVEENGVPVNPKKYVN